MNNTQHEEHVHMGSAKAIDSNLLWLDYNHYSNDAAEALTSQAPDG
jgi:hypothetical protein